MLSDLENAEINTNIQLYYSTISEQTCQLHTHTQTHTKLTVTGWTKKLVNNKNLYMKLALIQTLFW